MPHKVTRLNIGGLQSNKKKNDGGSFAKRLKRFEEKEFYGT
jgi:hypothetical protein